MKYSNGPKVGKDMPSTFAVTCLHSPWRVCIDIRRDVPAALWAGTRDSSVFSLSFFNGSLPRSRDSPFLSVFTHLVKRSFQRLWRRASGVMQRAVEPAARRSGPLPNARLILGCSSRLEVPETILLDHGARSFSYAVAFGSPVFCRGFLLSLQGNDTVCRFRLLCYLHWLLVSGKYLLL